MSPAPVVTFISTLESCVYAFPDGMNAFFIRSRYSTSAVERIEQLRKEIRVGCTWLREATPEESEGALDQSAFMANLIAGIREEERAKIQAAMRLGDLGTSQQSGALGAASTANIPTLDQSNSPASAAGDDSAVKFESASAASVSKLAAILGK